ncbi:MAG: GNAT family protein [Candidatus Pacebacteria bacterium]|nr:GNAT family protein [Candidatus Paceibacterota bacterium]
MLKRFKTKKGKDISIRYVCLSDTKDLLEMYNSVVEEKNYTTAVKKFTLKEETLFVKSVLSKIVDRREIFLVAEYEGKVLGVATIEKEVTPIKTHRAEFGIMLKKDIRGEGVGEELTKAVIKEAKRFLKVKMITLNVFEENVPAVNLYKKIGFVVFGRLEKGVIHFKKLKTELLMVKCL